MLDLTNGPTLDNITNVIRAMNVVIESEYLRSRTTSMLYNDMLANFEMLMDDEDSLDLELVNEPDVNDDIITLEILVEIASDAQYKHPKNIKWVTVTNWLKAIIDQYREATYMLGIIDEGDIIEITQDCNYRAISPNDYMIPRINKGQIYRVLRRTFRDITIAIDDIEVELLPYDIKLIAKAVKEDNDIKCKLVESDGSCDGCHYNSDECYVGYKRQCHHGNFIFVPE